MKQLKASELFMRAGRLRIARIKSIRQSLETNGEIANCVVCNQPLSIVKSKYRAKYCSDACEKEAVKRKYEGLNGKRPDLSTGKIGAMGELAVSVDLMRRGLDVYRALSPSAPSDLIVLWKGIPISVEVRTGQRVGNGEISRAKHKHLSDILALVLDQGTYIIYQPDLESFLI